MEQKEKKLLKQKSDGLKATLGTTYVSLQWLEVTSGEVTLKLSRSVR